MAEGVATKFEHVGRGTATSEVSFVLHEVVAPSALKAVRVNVVE
jgi:hypothetical protein